MTIKPPISNPQSPILLLLLLLYLLITLPNLANYPIIEAAQNGIAAPAHKLAQTGIYGNDLYRGWHQTDTLNYEYMPLYPLTIALFYKLLGLGIWQGRLVSIFSGLLTLALTYRLGKRLFNHRVGLYAATALTLLPLTIANHTANDMYPGQIPLLDFARILRYDVMVPVWVLAACLCFLTRTPNKQTYLATGLFIGLATLSHIYGAFILIPLAAHLFWQKGWDTFKHPAGYLILLGTLLPLLPWLIYIAQDLTAYQGQQLRHGTRFDLLSPAFYLNNLRWEPWRYIKFIGSFRQPSLWPRPGLYLTLLTTLTANIHLLRHRHQPHHRFTLLTLPLLILTLALLISFKRYTYTILLLPFLALQIGLGLDHLLRRAYSVRPRTTHHALRTTLAVLLLATLTQTTHALTQHWQTGRDITPYQTLLQPIRQTIPAGSRILLSHQFWLPLTDYDTLALDLTFVLTNDQTSMTHTLTQLNPHYILVPDWLLNQYQTNPAGLPNDTIRHKWRDLHTYIQTHCPQIYTGPPSPHYGRLLLFDCSNSH